MNRPRLFVLLCSGALSTMTAAVPGGVRAGEPVVIVQPGDTISGLARAHGVDQDTLVELNALADPNRIYAGQRLRLRADSGAGQVEVAAADPRSHVVRRGENLTRIARQHGVTVAAIVSANGLANPNRIYAGQRLVIPGTAGVAPAPPAAAAPAPATPAASVHVVAAGENLTRIGRRYGVSVAAIAATNRLADPGRIFPGQRLAIPGAAAPTAAAAPPSPAVAPAPAMSALMASLVARRDAVRVVIVEEAARYGVPAPFAMAVGWQESGWQQHAVSSAGARGVMQLMPGTAVWVGQTMLGAPVAIDDLRSNVRAGVRLLAHYLDRYDGNRELTLAAYYQGQAGTDRHGVYPGSRGYVASILHLEKLFGG